MGISICVSSMLFLEANKLTDSATEIAIDHQRAILLSQPSEIAERGALYKSALEKALLAETVAQHTRDVRASDINRAAQLTYDIFVQHNNFRCELQHNFKLVYAAEHMAKFADREKPFAKLHQSCLVSRKIRVAVVIGRLQCDSVSEFTIVSGYIFRKISQTRKVRRQNSESAYFQIGNFAGRTDPNTERVCNGCPTLQ
ncbi:hypothetical protein T03_2718 [Trichinella britovi]|uniref:Uncharacterized protein n=1 Tax=Trichinella britovi TaxID=45882 RepID=A0A0V1DJA2_TRIBR|nr:hypothetical protein T03_2718 [Trichinella britovi]